MGVAEERWGKGIGGGDGGETVIQVNKLINLIKLLHGGNFKYERKVNSLRHGQAETAQRLS